MNDIFDQCFLLDPACYLVRGACRGAVYNLSTGDVFSIEERSTEILEQCEAGLSLAQILEGSCQVHPDELIGYLKDLEAAGIGQFYRKPLPYLEKVQPIITQDQIKAHFIAVPPSYAFLEITNTCNYDCAFCDPASPAVRRKTGCSRWASGEPLNIDEWLAVVDDLAWIRCQALHIMGGEPWLAPKFLMPIVQLAHERGIPNLIVFTNTTRLDEKYIRFLSDYNVQLLIQVYSHRADVHDQIVNRPGSYAQLVGNLAKLRAAGIPFSFNLLVTEATLDDYGPTVEALQAYGPQRITADILRPAQPADACQLSLAPYLFRSRPQFQKVDRSVFFHSRQQNMCWFGKLAVTASGEVLPCIAARTERIGNIREKSLKQMFADKDFEPYWYLKMDQIEGCAGCEYRYACTDCRPLARSVDGRLTAKDPYCTYDPLHGKWRIPDTDAESALVTPAT